MSLLLTALPVLTAIGLLLVGRGAVTAAVVSAAAAAVVGVGTGSLSWNHLGEAGEYGLLTLQVLLILLFGMLLAALLERSGAMAELSRFLSDSVPTPALGAAAVVFGVVPFAESVTGYGVGVTVGVPILRALGFAPARAVILGMLGLNTAVWGALGPGTSIAAQLSGQTFRDVGVFSALFFGPTLLLVAASAWLTLRLRTGEPDSPHSEQRGLTAAIAVFGSALLLWAAVLTVNLLIGTAVAGVLGGLIVLIVLFGFFRLRRGRLPARRATAVAGLPYAVLTGGLLASYAAYAAWENQLTAILIWPPVWLAAACATVFFIWRRRALLPEVPSAVRRWVPVGVSTGGFMMLGWIMTVTGMSTALGEAASVLGVWPAPTLNTLGGYLVGNTTGSNAMFAQTIASMAAGSGADVLLTIAAANVACSLAIIASPPRLLLGMQMAGANPASDQRPITRILSAAVCLNTLVITAVLTAAVRLSSAA